MRTLSLPRKRRHRFILNDYFVIIVLFYFIPCIFTFSDTFYFEIKENSPPQTYVGKISTKAGYTYRFNDDPIEFELNPETGVIQTTSVRTDREIKSVYNLVILSSSPTYPLEVKIRILDVNDNVPFWPSYINTNISFSESAPVGTKVIIDNAVDLDSGELEYRIDGVSDTSSNDEYSQDSLLPFKLNYNSSTSFLHLEVALKLDREVQSNYLVNITAIDQDGQSNSAIFNIQILDSNDNPPIFDHSDYSMSINESMNKDVSILQVRATDADEEDNSNSRISYYLNSDDFKIDQNSGVIFTAHDGPITCGTSTEKTENEYWRVCVFTVFAHDYGVPRQDGRTYVTAKIYDSNNHSPIIKFRYFSKSDFANVDENATNGSVVAAVSVVDFDHGLNGKTALQITEGNELSHFRLDSIGNSHIIRVNGVLDREKVPQYNLTVLGRDYGTPRRSSSASLVIMVQDHNDHAPKFDREEYETVLTETRNQIGMFVYALQATDLDEGINSQIYFSLSGANSHYFKIDSNSGLVTTDKVINREEIDYFELRITARDGGSNPKWAHALLKVKILDINDEAPTILLESKYAYNNNSSAYEVNVKENTFLEIPLTVHDGDLGNNGTVDLEILYDYDNLFKFDTQSMKLVSTERLDFEKCNMYTILVLAKDRAPAQHQLMTLTTIIVNLVDSDDILPRLYPSKYFSFVPINGFNSINYSVMVNKLQINDADQTSPVSFAIRSNDEIVEQLFYLTKTGEIKFKSNADLRPLKNGPTKVLTFEVVCIGCQQSHNRSQVNIFLANFSNSSSIQDKPKSEYSFVIEENVPVDTVVGELELDSEAFQLSIISGNMNDEFKLWKNLLKTNKPLDREMVSTFKLQVVAVSSDYFHKIEISIQLTDVNDCMPHFYSPFDQISINEDAPPMSVVYRLNAFDADLGGNQSLVWYRVVENPFDLFMIDGHELKLSKTIAASVQPDNKLPINYKIMRVKIVAADSEMLSSRSDKRTTTVDKLHKQCHLSNELILFIKIIPTTNSKARFVKKYYEIFISESVPINEQIFQLEARNIYDNSFSYSIMSGNSNNSFGILPNGHLYTRNQLDRENIDVYLLNIILYEAKQWNINATSINPTDTCQVLIHIKDVNDNKPIFDRKAYQFAVPENEPNNFFIGQVIATDQDVDSNSQIIYSIIKSYYSSFVDIDPNTGYIWSNKEYDRETLAYFEIIVQATDQPIDETKFSSQVVVRVDILDVNDNEPIFEIPANVTMTSKNGDGSISGELIVSEATPVDSILAHFYATDNDSESSITYWLREDASIAHLNVSTGILRLTTTLDREKRDNYQLLVEAFDGKHKSFFNLIVTVEDVDDCEPVWVNLTKTEFSVPENISIGSEILKFDVVDHDLGQNALFHFLIENYSGNQKVFDILDQKLIVINNLDYEKNKVHYLNISLIESNSGRISSTKNIRINLIDINDCKPVFIQRTETEVVHVLENIEIGSKLLTLQASDCDMNDVLTYEIVSCNTHYHTHKNIYQKDHELKHKHDSNNCPLKLNTKTGEIININNLDREVIESINLKLSVKDGVGHTDKMKVIFIINDINDESPMFVSPKKILINKDLNRPNMIVGNVKAIDLDLGINSAITYKLEQYEDFLELDKFTGVFKTRRSLQPLLKQGDLYLNVTAMDGGGLSTTDTIQLIAKPNHLYLKPININIDIYENEPIGTQITRLKCDNDIGQSQSCRFHLINATDRNFDVDAETGIITTVDLIDREMLERRLLEVLVVSQYHLQLFQVQINILDQNDNPPYLTNTSIVVHLKESLPEGTEVFDLSRLIADEDTNNKFDFQIINCSTCNGIFSLSRKTGILTLQAQLDSERANKYRILFGVSDGIYLLTSLMDIIVDDENDNEPYFKQPIAIFHINENTDRGTVVGQVTAFDDDISNENLIYLTKSNYNEYDTSFNAFSLDSRSGQFTLSKRLDYETDPNEYVLYVEASDGKYRSQPVKVIFRLINLPDNPPTFSTSLYKLEVTENKVFDEIICLKATDADLDRDNNIDSLDNYSKQIFNLTYRIDFGFSKSIQDSIRIDSTNGCISIVKPLDRENLSNFDLTVIADDRYFNATALVSVKVLDENDNYPIFEKKTSNIMQIEENIPIDTVVHTFKAVDLDEPPNSYIKYEIIQRDIEPSKFPFVIGSIDGVLKVTAPIDRELVDHYDMVIRANDYGLKYTDFACRIEIKDVIDNSPVFEKSYYELNIYENVSVGESVFQLVANDADQTDEINYKIISGDNLGHFKIEDDLIVVAMKLDYEEISEYNLKINAIDKAGNLDTVNIKMLILNILDEKPIFADSPYFVNWIENEVGVIGMFESIPDDMKSHSVLHGHINYILLNNFENSFRLNSSNAVLTVIKQIDREALVKLNSEAIIDLKIIAIDSLSRMSSEGLIRINIIDANDNVPKFENDNYVFYLTENKLYEHNTIIGVVKAIDLDQADDLQYELISEYPDKFTINSDGKIFVNSSVIFDRELQQIYYLKVVTRDSKYETSTIVKVIINDVNDCVPKVTKINSFQMNDQNNNQFDLAIPVNKLNLILSKKFPLIGFEVSDCDADLNGKVQFRMNNDALYDILKIDEKSGVIKSDYRSIKMQQDRLSKLSNIDITVTDLSNVNQLSSSYSINLQLINNNLYNEATLVKDDFIELYISETTPVNQTLYQFEIMQIVSEINIYAGDVYDHFTVVENSLVLKRMLDFESTVSYDLYLEAINHQNDHYDQFQYIFVRINVNNENDNPPVFISDIYNATIQEEEANCFVTQVFANDLDSVETKIRYKLVNETDIPFKIDSNTGNIWSTSKIDRETIPSFQLTVLAEDEDGLSSTCKVLVSIGDKNDNPPRFTRLFKANITENAPIGSFVTQVTSVDKDLRKYSNVTYNILTKTEAFVIDSVSGNVFVAANLDREENEEYFLTVSADDGSWKAQTTLTVYILDENDVAPQFDKDVYGFEIELDPQYDNKQPLQNVIVGQVEAFDPDQGVNGVISYKLKNRSKYFSINSETGVLYLKKLPKLFGLDLFFLNQYFITVIAMDKGLLPKFAEVNVIIKCYDANSASQAKQSNKVSINVPRNLANNTPLYTWNSMISLVGSDQQIVNTKYNQLIFTGQFNVQLNANYTFEIDNYFDKISFNLFITEANSYAPFFVNDQNSTTIMESYLDFKLISQFKAVDQDESAFNNIVHYSFNITKLHWNANCDSYLHLNYQDKYSHLFKKNLSTDEIIGNIPELTSILNPFFLNQTTGELNQAHQLDYEVITGYSLVIIATDNAWYTRDSSYNFEILVGDVDDFIDYNLIDTNTLHHASMKPDPMSIGVILVIFFFVILILVISTSFIFYHNQKKSQLRDMHIPIQRKMMTNSLSPYLSSNSPLSSQSCFANQQHLQSRPQVPVARPPQQQQLNSSSIRCQPPPLPPQPQQPLSQAQQQLQQQMDISQNVLRMNSLCKPQFRHEVPNMNPRLRHPQLSSHQLLLKQQPDIVSLNPVASSHSVCNGSESASMIASRMQHPTGTSSIYTHTNSENYTDNYSNILASAEHYDLENASSIAPSDIDIVYHYKGYRNRDPLMQQHQKHAPLSRLSPSVSELSSVPRILTLQDLSPQVPPCPPPIMNRNHLHKPLNCVNGDDDVAITENSFTCSEFGENYDICKKDKNMFDRAW